MNGALDFEVISNQSELKNINREGQIEGFQQEVYVSLPDSAYPVKTFIRTKKPLQTGLYTIYPSFRNSKYENLELNPFAYCTITPKASSKDLKSA